MKHNCPVTGCEREVPRKYLMCGPHWRLVSPATKARVWEAWTDLAKGKAGSRASYQAARDEAIEEVQEAIRKVEEVQGNG